MTLPASRAIANRCGASRYRTGRPCKHGHISDRYVMSGSCVDCLSAFGAQAHIKEKSRVRARVWSSDNPGEAKRRTLTWRKANPGKQAEYNREWRLRHVDASRLASRISSKRTRQDRPHVKSAAEALRRARKASGTPLWVRSSEIRLIYQACPKGLTVDHIVPLKNESVCGLHVPWNLRYLTATDNSRKRNAFHVVFRSCYQ